MSSSDQIKQMVAFIKQEAQEKCEEIRTNAEKEFVAQTEDLLSKKREELEKLYEKKKKDLVVQQRIKKSNIVNSAHFESMAARDGAVKKIKSEVSEKLAAVSKHSSYPDLIRFLIVQGLMMMMEKQITLKCRAEDKDVVNAQLESAVKQFQDLLEASTVEKDEQGTIKVSGVRPACQIVIDSHNFLPPGPKKEEQEVEDEELRPPSCCGGVYLIAKGGKIVCDNTLDTRLNLAYEALAPEIRGILFGVKPAAVYKKVEAHH